MSKLFEWSRRLCREAELAAPPLVRQAVMPRVHNARVLAHFLVKPYLTVYQWQGQGQGGSLTVNYAGFGDAKPYLKDILFVDKPAECEIGRVPIRRINELADWSTGDITIIEADEPLIARLPSQKALVLPAFIKMVLDTQGDWEEIDNRFHKSIRSERRLIRKYGYQFKVSHSDQDFEMFHRDMYLPTMDIRHGELAVSMSKHEVYQYFRRGLLFLLERDGKYVSGSIGYVDQDVVRFILVGVMNGDQQLMKEGVVGALNYLRLQWVNQSGYKSVDFGWYRPFMKSMFLNKRKWGTTVDLPSSQKGRLWIKLQRHTPAVSQFIQEAPCIVIDKQHRLYGLITVDHGAIAVKDNPGVVVSPSSLEGTDDPANLTDEAKGEWNKKYATPGLDGLLIRSVGELVGEVEKDNHRERH